MKKTPERIRQQYCSQKLRDLKEFGYNTLTLDHVQEQYDKVLAKSSDLTVIGKFIKSDFDQLEDN